MRSSCWHTGHQYKNLFFVDIYELGSIILITCFDIEYITGCFTSQHKNVDYLNFVLNLSLLKEVLILG